MVRFIPPARAQAVRQWVSLRPAPIPLAFRIIPLGRWTRLEPRPLLRAALPVSIPRGPPASLRSTAILSVIPRRIIFGPATPSLALISQMRARLLRPQVQPRRSLALGTALLGRP